MNVISVTRAHVSALVTDDRDTVIVSEVTLLIICPIILSQRHRYYCNYICMYNRIGKYWPSFVTDNR